MSDKAGPIGTLFRLLGEPKRLQTVETRTLWKQQVASFLAEHPEYTREDLVSMIEYGFSEEYWASSMTSMEEVIRLITKTKFAQNWERDMQGRTNKAKAKASKVGPIFEHIKKLRKLQAEGKL